MDRKHIIQFMNSGTQNNTAIGDLLYAGEPAINYHTGSPIFFIGRGIGAGQFSSIIHTFKVGGTTEEIRTLGDYQSVRKGTLWTQETAAGYLSIAPLNSVSATSITLTAADIFITGRMTVSGAITGQDHITMDSNKYVYADTSALNSRTLANVAWVDSKINDAKMGLSGKDSVKLATVPGEMSTVTGGTDSIASLASTVTIDGVLVSDTTTIPPGTRILIKDHATVKYNGIYVAGTYAALALPITRATDAWDPTLKWEALISAFVFVEQGPTNAETGWLDKMDKSEAATGANNTFIKFFSGSIYSPGNGIAISGVNVISAVANSATAITVTASGIGLALNGVNNSSGLVQSGSGVAVKLGSGDGTHDYPGLELLSDASFGGLKIKTPNSAYNKYESGLKFASSGVQVALKSSTSGLTIDSTATTGGLAVVAVAGADSAIAGGLSVTSSGVQLNLNNADTTHFGSGLYLLNSGKLSVKLAGTLANFTSGLALDATTAGAGLKIQLATWTPAGGTPFALASGLELYDYATNGGLRIKLKNTTALKYESGLEILAAGIAIKTKASSSGLVIDGADNGGLAVVGYVASGISVTSNGVQLNLNNASNYASGLQITGTNKLAIKLYNGTITGSPWDSGLELDTSANGGLKIKLSNGTGVYPGLELLSDALTGGLKILTPNASDTTYNSGLKVDDDGLSIALKTSTSGLTIDTTDTTGGLAVVALAGSTNAISGGLSVTSSGVQLNLDNADTTHFGSGLYIKSGLLSVKLAGTAANFASGLELDTAASGGLKTHLALYTPANGGTAYALPSGLELYDLATNGGLRIKLKNSAATKFESGFDITSTGLELKLHGTNPCLEIDSSGAGGGLRAKLDTSRGIVSSSAGIQLKLNNVTEGTSFESGLYFNSGTLGIKVNTNYGLSINSTTGLGINLASTSYGLQFATGALSHRLRTLVAGGADRSGLKESAADATYNAGIYVNINSSDFAYEAVGGAICISKVDGGTF